MNIKKLTHGALLAAALMVSPACNDDFLDKVRPAQQTDGTFFRNEAEAQQGLTTAYSILNHLRIAQMKFTLGDIASDDAVKGSTDTDASYISEIKSFTATSGNIGFTLAWYPQWNGVYYANTVLQNVPRIKMNETVKKQILAEARFLRAFYYFEMAKNFGGLPLFPEPVDAATFVPRSTLEETYAFIAEDLKAALPDLKRKSQLPRTEMGRATQGAAAALLGKVYLYAKKYPEAAAALSKVTEGELAGDYTLPVNFEGIFRMEGEHGPGSVFEINYLGDDMGTWQNQGNFGTVFQMPRLWGWGFNQPSASLVNAFENGDPRLGAGVMSYLEAQILESPTLKDVVSTKNTGFYQRKSYLYPGERPDWWRKSSVNYRAIRLADVYLMHAEAAAQTGDAGKAQTLLNKVRQRAAQSGALSAAPGFDVLDVPASSVADQGALAGLAAGDKLVMVNIVQASSAAASSIPATDANVAAVSGANKWVFTAGTVVKSVDGSAVTSKADFINKLKSKSAGASVKFEVAVLKQTENGGAVSTAVENKTVTVTLAQVLPAVNASGEALLKAIYNERRVELSSEHHRFYDIVRTGRGTEILGSAGFKAGRNEVYPIPQGDIDLSNNVLKQNPGY